MCTLCDKPRWARGWCRMHYMRWWKYGDPNIIGNSARGPGAQNGNWKGDQVSYGGAHARVRRKFGTASWYSCVDCGLPAQQWSYNHQDGIGEIVVQLPNHRGELGDRAYSPDPHYYDPRCTHCHRVFDGTKNGRKHPLIGKS